MKTEKHCDGGVLMKTMGEMVTMKTTEKTRETQGTKSRTTWGYGVGNKNIQGRWDGRGRRESGSRAAEPPPVRRGGRTPP